MNRHVQCKIIKVYYEQIVNDPETGPRYVKLTGDSVYEEEICWLPEKFAKIGVTIDIRANDRCKDNWEVKEVYRPALSSSWVAERTQDHKKMKKMTDI